MIATRSGLPGVPTAATGLATLATSGRPGRRRSDALSVVGRRRVGGLVGCVVGAHDEIDGGHGLDRFHGERLVWISAVLGGRLLLGRSRDGLCHVAGELPEG